MAGSAEATGDVAHMTKSGLLEEVQSLQTRLNELAEECADLMILLLGTAISADLDLRGAFWSKMTRLESRESRMVDGRIRVSAFGDAGREVADISPERE